MAERNESADRPYEITTNTSREAVKASCELAAAAIAVGRNICNAECVFPGEGLALGECLVASDDIVFPQVERSPLLNFVKGDVRQRKISPEPSYFEAHNPGLTEELVKI